MPISFDHAITTFHEELDAASTFQDVAGALESFTKKITLTKKYLSDSAKSMENYEAEWDETAEQVYEFMADIPVQARNHPSYPGLVRRLTDALSNAVTEPYE